MYLTFDEYLELGGQEIEETTFNELEFEARAVVDWWTFNRLQNEETQQEAVKMCMYKLIKLIQDKQIATAIAKPVSESNSTIQPGIIQESNDGVTTMYNTMSAKETITTLDDEMKTVIKRYLQGIRNSLGQKVLYRGVYPNE